MKESTEDAARDIYAEDAVEDSVGPGPDRGRAQSAHFATLNTCARRSYPTVAPHTTFLIGQCPAAQDSCNYKRIYFSRYETQPLTDSAHIVSSSIKHLCGKATDHIADVGVSDKAAGQSRLSLA